MKPIPPDTDDHTPKSVHDILNRHGATLNIKGARGSSHKAIAEELIAELETERHRSTIVQNNLNAILGQYQVAANSLKQLQAGYDEISRRYQEKLDVLKRLEAANGTTDSDDTDTEGK